MPIDDCGESAASKHDRTCIGANARGSPSNDDGLDSNLVRFTADERCNLQRALAGTAKAESTIHVNLERKPKMRARIRALESAKRWVWCIAMAALVLPPLLPVRSHARVDARVQERKPNIVIIWGDDIGQSNISAYSMGLMGYRTPNIDRIAKEGMMFTDAYAEQSCTAGRASFITGQSGLRTGMTKVGLPGSPLGLQKEDPTIA